MTVTIAGRSVSLGAILAAVGGVLAIVGAPLAWVSSTVGDKTDSAGGLDEGTKMGMIAIVLGIVALVLVAAWVMKIKLPPVAGLPLIPVLVIVVGVLILLVPILAYFTTLLAEESLKSLMDAGWSFGPGFLAEVVAGIVVIVGGVLPLLKKRS